jgi:hypothetical protein
MPLSLEVWLRGLRLLVGNENKAEKRLHDIYEGFVLDMDRCCGPGALEARLCACFDLIIYTQC